MNDKQGGRKYKKTKETEAKEIMNRAVLEYYLVKKGKHLKNFYSLRLQIQ